MDSIFISLEIFLKDAKLLDHITTHSNKLMEVQILKSDMLVISAMLMPTKTVKLNIIEKIILLLYSVHIAFLEDPVSYMPMRMTLVSVDTHSHPQLEMLEAELPAELLEHACHELNTILHI